MLSLSAVLAASLILLLAGCGGDQTPEERVRSYIDQVAKSAEARDWGSFQDYVADDYKDEKGLSKHDVLAIIAHYLLANQRIYILKRLAMIETEDPENAHAVVYAALAGHPVSDPQDLARIRADIYRFAIDLRAEEDGILRTIRGDWQPVGPEKFLIGR